jgi:hypothetical protein
MPYVGAAARDSPPWPSELQDRFAELSEAMPDVGSVAVVLGVCFADERPLSTADREYLTALGGISALTLARGPR